MKALLGRKLGMSQIFSEDGTATPVTLVRAGPCTVVGVRTPEANGYSAVQLGFETGKRTKKPQQGQFSQLETDPAYVREVRGEYDVQVGNKIDVGNFAVGDTLTVTGTSKGRGFTGTIKRHNFSRGPETHGSRNQRQPGSIGGMYPQKVWKGKKMAGRSGNKTVTQQNRSIAAVDTENSLLAIKGAVPGKQGGLVILKGDE
ncbi:50S ribosomal protein L3 [Candidatus Saccharibacteria bacterium QS_8_54_8]|nr:MAG: 50S ribosomal protein L3 [Candidatus Saccharibacteria bacterium QS_8_54_8]